MSYLLLQSGEIGFVLYSLLIIMLMSTEHLDTIVMKVILFDTFKPLEKILSSIGISIDIFEIYMPLYF